jgi:hypothetical protein
MLTLLVQKYKYWRSSAVSAAGELARQAASTKVQILTQLLVQKLKY